MATAGCSKKEITSLERKQAAALVSEAQFATTMRDFARAETLLAQATSLCPDTGAYWLQLGASRIKLGQREPARAAYKGALKAFEDTAKKQKEPEAALQQVYVLALLGRVDDARALQEKLVSRYPDSRDVKIFVEEKRLDRILADPGFKQMAL